MNKNLLDFFKAHDETAFKFNLELRKLKELLRSKTKKVAESVDRRERFPRFGFWSCLDYGDETSPYIYDSCYSDTKIAGAAVRVEVSVYINKRGWEIFIWPFEGGDFSKVCKWLEERKLRPTRVNQTDKQWIYVEIKDPELSLAEEKVGVKLQELLEAISKGRGPKEVRTLSVAQKRRQ